MNISAFFADCPKIPFWSVLSLSCYCLFKIYTSYIISKCKSVKMINITWVSVQSYKRLTLRVFKELLFRKTNGRQIIVIRLNTFSNVLMFILRELYLFTSKKIAFMSSTKWLFHSAYFCDCSMKKNVFCGINFCDVGILWKKCRIYFRDPNVLTNFFQPSLKKKIRYTWE